jgi:hypothetical protein
VTIYAHSALTSAAPARTRYRAGGFLFLLAGVTYLDRICISTLTPDISRDLQLQQGPNEPGLQVPGRGRLRGLSAAGGPMEARRLLARAA